MTRRKVLNISSIKKHDNMQPVVLDPAGVRTAGPITVGTGFASLFIPSARAISDSDVGEAHRERQTIYAKGYLENITVTLQAGASWRWRRIVFTAKGLDLFSGYHVPWSDFFTDPEVGSMERAISLMPTAQYVSVRDQIFDGAEGIDWTDQFNAKFDTTRFTLLSDKRITLNPGNESGLVKRFRFYQPLGHNIMYDDDENGSSGQNTYLSTRAKIGMGDIYVYDFVQIMTQPATGEAQLTFSPEGCFYWHER